MTTEDPEPQHRNLAERVFTVQRNPRVRPWLAAVLSLAIPGLGQLYIGQYVKGVMLFFGSASLCFGLGLCNVVAALDAHSLAGRLHERDIQRGDVSAWLYIARALVVWAGRALRHVTDRIGLTGGRFAPFGG